MLFSKMYERWLRQFTGCLFDIDNAECENRNYKHYWMKMTPKQKWVVKKKKFIHLRQKDALECIYYIFLKKTEGTVFLKEIESSTTSLYTNLHKMNHYPSTHPTQPSIVTSISLAYFCCTSYPVDHFSWKKISPKN